MACYTVVQVTVYNCNGETFKSVGLEFGSLIYLSSFLEAFYEAFKALPTLQKYFASDDYKMDVHLGCQFPGQMSTLVHKCAMFRHCMVSMYTDYPELSLNYTHQPLQGNIPPTGDQ